MSDTPLADPRMAGGWDASPKWVWQKGVQQGWGLLGVNPGGVRPPTGPYRDPHCPGGQVAAGEAGVQRGLDVGRGR